MLSRSNNLSEKQRKKSMLLGRGSLKTVPEKGPTLRKGPMKEIDKNTTMMTDSSVEKEIDAEEHAELQESNKEADEAARRLQAFE